MINNLFLVLITATANTKNSKNIKNTAVVCPKTIVYINNTAVVCPKITVYAYKAVATSIKSFFQTYYTDKSGLLFSEKQPITTHYFDKKSQNNNPKIAILTAKIV